MAIVKSLGITVVAAIHDLNIAAAFCDQLFLMQDGRIAACGRPESVLTPRLIKSIYAVEAERILTRSQAAHFAFHLGEDG